MLDCSQAIEMFQAAIDLDPRQYNAWWGLGDVFQRQEDFAQAKYNFLRALDINPSNQAFGLGMVGRGRLKFDKFLPFNDAE